MKRLLFILTLLCLNFILKAQYPAGRPYPLTQNLGSDSTKVDGKGAIQSRFINKIFTDTTQANTQPIKNYGGAQIFTTSDTSLWLRTPQANRWVKPRGGSGTITSFNFLDSNSLIICYSDGSCDTIPLINFSTVVNNITNNANITTTISGDTIIICDGAGNCDTLLFTGGGDVFNYYFLNDSTLIACGDTTVVCQSDTCELVQVCDTLSIPTVKALILQSGLERIGNIGYLGGQWTGVDNPVPFPVTTWLQRPTVINGFAHPFSIIGEQVWNPALLTFQRQYWGISTDIVSFLSTGSAAGLDANNRNQFRIGYFGNNYDGVTNWGYIGQNAGYYVGTNLVGRSSYGIGVNSIYSKYSAAIFHTNDTLNGRAITFLGGRPPLSSILGQPLQADSTTLQGQFILDLNTDKSARWYGYGSTSQFLTVDTTNNKPLVSDINGNMKRLSYWPGAGTTYTASNGVYEEPSHTFNLGSASPGDATLSSNRYIYTGSRSLQIYSDDAGIPLVLNQLSNVTALSSFSTGGKAAQLATGNSTTNTIITSAALERNSESTPATGMGGALEMQLETSNNTNNFVANKIIWKWGTDASTAGAHSRLVFQGVTGGSLGDIATMDGTGVVGIGIGSSFNSTRLDLVDNSVAGASIANISTTSTAAASNAQKGLNVSLSGANSTASQSTYGIYSSNTHTGSGSINYGITGIASGGGTTYGVDGTGGNAGVRGTTSGAGNGVEGQGGGSGIGVYGVGANNAGVFAVSTGFSPFHGEYQGATVNDVLPLLRITRSISGGTPSNGIGGSIDMRTLTDDFNDYISNQLISKWTTAADLTRTSQFIISGVTSATTQDWLTIGQSGYVKFRPMTVTEAGAIATAEGLMVFVSNTDATFTSVGLWIYQNGAWKAL